MNTQAGRELFSLTEIYDIVYKGISTSLLGFTAVRQGQISKDFKERLMLAVTEVNNCPMCSYFHAKVALETGISPEEIEALLAGSMENVPTQELPAILFAQHYAETRGKPSREAFRNLVKQYGFDNAHAILGIIRTIMMGNAYGIPFGSLKNRFKGKADSRCSLKYELSVAATLLPFLFIAFIHILFSRLMRQRAKLPQFTTT